MNQQAYRINTRLATGDGEYLIQTVNDATGKRVISSLFSDGELLDKVEEYFESGIKQEELQKIVNAAHEDRRRELAQLVEMYRNSSQKNDPTSLDYLGQALFFKKMYPEALNLFSRSTRIDPEFHQGWFHLGLVQFALNKFEDSCHSLSRAVEIRPRFADYRNCLGEAFLALSSCKRAVIEFDEALKINIYYGEAYLNLALAYILNAIRREDFSLFANQEEMTKKALEKAGVIMPDIEDDDFREGMRLFEQGSFEKAFARLLACREKRRSAKYFESSSFFLKFMLDSEQLNEKIITRRIKYLQNAINNNPHYADLHYELAVAYTLLGKFIQGKSIEEYKKALSLNPDFDRAQRNLKLAENELKGTDVVIQTIMKG